MRERKLREMKKIAETIRGLSRPGMKPKCLVDAVKERHPDASRKEIARAAFLSVICRPNITSEDCYNAEEIRTGCRRASATLFGSISASAVKAPSDTGMGAGPKGARPSLFSATAVSFMRIPRNRRLRAYGNCNSTSKSGLGIH